MIFSSVHIVGKVKVIEFTDEDPSDFVVTLNNRKLSQSIIEDHDESHISKKRVLKLVDDKIKAEFITYLLETIKSRRPKIYKGIEEEVMQNT